MAPRGLSQPETTDLGVETVLETVGLGGRGEPAGARSGPVLPTAGQLGPSPQSQDGGLREGGRPPQSEG